MRILFHMLPEPGHLNPTFPVAKRLSDRGHEVLYTSVLDLQPLIEARGFRCVPVHRDIIRRGRLDEIDQLEATDQREAAWQAIRDRITEEYLEGAIEEMLRELDPDLVAADVITLSPLQLAAHRLRIPCLQISTSLSQRRDELPPLSSPLTPDASALELEAAWWAAGALRFCRFEHVPVANLMAWIVDINTARFGYPGEHVSFESVFTPVWMLAPEIVLCAPALDFPRRGTAGPTYLATPVDLDRREHVPEELEAFVARHGTLVYAALGSQAARYPEALRFFRSVVGAARAHPAWGVVIASGPQLSDHPVFADRPGNVLIVRSAPQLWLLGRAAVFVTHAGLGGIREAVALGVPMIAVPQQYDQLGNAARVAYHQIGLRISAEAITDVRLAAALQHLLGDHAGYRARVARLHDACVADQARHEGIDLFERTAAARAEMGDRARTWAPRPRAVARETANETANETAAEGWMFLERSGPASLQPGRAYHDRRTDQPIDVGGGGFTICRDLPGALSRSTGALLARVEVTGDLAAHGRLVAGRVLRCHWTADVDEPLYEFAAWCADQVLDAELPTAPETVAALKEQIRTFHAARRGGASRAALVERFRAMFASAQPLWHRGHGIAASAIAVASHEAARDSRWLALQYLARAFTGASAGTFEGADRFEGHYRETSDRFARELARRIDARARAARTAAPGPGTSGVC